MELYNIIKLLGTGTFGTVHLCERIHSHQKVVVKKINVNINRNELEVAKNESNILKSLKHPNVIQFYDSFIKNDALFIVMEYATQGTLFEFILKSKPNGLNPQMVMDLFCQILIGVNHIHSKKIVHRDLKCENIFLTGLESNVIKIGDFGIAKMLPNNKKAHTLIGTYNYLAPELCNGKPYNIKSDIWALGCILYEMCSMEKMFDGTLSNVVTSITSGRKKSVNVKMYGVQMQQIIDSMLALDPEERPTTTDLMTLADIAPSLAIIGTNLGCISPDQPFTF